MFEAAALFNAGAYKQFYSSPQAAGGSNKDPEANAVSEGHFLLRFRRDVVIGLGQIFSSTPWAIQLHDHIYIPPGHILYLHSERFSPSDIQTPAPPHPPSSFPVMAETQTIAVGTMHTTGDLPKTDYTRWRLKTEDGRQTWHYLSEEEAVSWPQTIADKHHLGLPTVCHLSPGPPPLFFFRWSESLNIAICPGPP